MFIAAFLDDDGIDGILKIFPAFIINFFGLFILFMTGVLFLGYYLGKIIFIPLYDNSIGRFNKKINNEK